MRGRTKSQEDQGCKVQSRDPTEQEVELATLSPVLEFLQLPICFLSIHPCTSALSLWAALLQCASVVFAVAHLVAASGRTDPFVCFLNPGFAEID